VDERIRELHARRASARAMGGTDAIAQQHARGKLTARERLDLLFDAGTFVEMGLLAHHQSLAPDMAGRATPADGVITGCGKINGRLACAAAYDFTVMAGSMGAIGERKVKRMREWALRQRVPMIWLIDSAGARIQEAVGPWFPATGDLFFEEALASGVIPQVCAVMGPGVAGTAYIPGLADFVVMVRGRSFLALGGPPLVKAAVGEDVDEETLGGSRVHCEISGVADLEVEDDPACIAAVKRYLSYFPSHNQEEPPCVEPRDDPLRPVEGLEQVVPTDPRRAYDMRQVITRVVDADTFFEIKPRFARNLIVGLARLGGRPVGVVANQPAHLGGVLDVDAADKAARFIMTCDAFHIPLLFLVDTPGFIVGSRAEQQGIIRHGAKMLYAVSEATVPKVTVVIRKAYGAGYYVMCGRAYEPDLIVAWPTAEIGVMGPEGAVNILFRKEIAAAPDPDAARRAKLDEYRTRIAPYLAAEHAVVDDIIDPRETRAVASRALELARTKRVERPWRKHGVMPV